VNTDSSGENSKHIFLGNTRLVTKAEGKQYFYHPDHLESAQLITNGEGQEYEHIEYTPYGELWVEQFTGHDERETPFRFTGKEKDKETGLYYYGARYLDSKTSRWLSADPALGEYIPGAPVSDEAKEKNKKLPGEGGIFSTVNSNLYHYAGNNPVKYTDPDGKVITISRAADRSTIVKLINKMSAIKYEVGRDGVLKNTGQLNHGRRSDTYSRYLQKGIESEFSIDIKISAYTTPTNSGGGTNQSWNKKVSAEVRIDGTNRMTPGKSGQVEAPAAIILAHEIAGHAVPYVIGMGKNVNAVNIENRIRSETGLPHRKSDPAHVSYKTRTEEGRRRVLFKMERAKWGVVESRGRTKGRPAARRTNAQGW
jgi:RHS repeat-associated protein